MKKLLAAAMLALSLTASANTNQTYTPSADNIAARKHFQDSKFGIFLHWGLYAMLATGEWTMTNNNLNYKEYAKLAGGFYPSRFSAKEWVSQIKASGAKYICFTTRHHEGFSMFKSKYSDYNVVDASPFKRDIVKELADECHRQGIDIHFYYSHIDWQREDAPLGRTGLGTGRPVEKQNWDSYYTFMNNQLTELLTNYGKVGAIWFDGWWDQDINPSFDWRLPEQYALIHRLQPACLIGNNHHQTPFEGEDFQMFERDLPGENTAGLSGQSISQLQVDKDPHPLPREGCWPQRQPPYEHRSATRRLSARSGCAASEGNGRMDEDIRRDYIWYTWRTRHTTRLGRNNREGQQDIRTYPQPQGSFALPSHHRQERKARRRLRFAQGCQDAEVSRRSAHYTRQRAY